MFSIQLIESIADALALFVRICATVLNRFRKSEEGLFLISKLTFILITNGKSRAHIEPCGAENIPPKGAASPCVAPNFAFAKAKPLNKLAIHISSLADLSPDL